MKRLAAFFVLTSILFVALPALWTQTNIGDKTNLIIYSNSPGVFSIPHSNTNFLLATPSNTSKPEFLRHWSPWIYGTVLSGERSNQSGWVWFEILNTNYNTVYFITNTNGAVTNTNTYLPTATNKITNLGGAIFVTPPRSMKREAGNKIVFLAKDTRFTVVSNLTDWFYGLVNSGTYSNTAGYFPVTLISNSTSGTNVQVTNGGGALRTAPYFPAMGPSLGKKFYIPAATTFLYGSNQSTWVYMSRSDWTNGFHSNNFIAVYSINTNFYTNVWTNQR